MKTLQELVSSLEDKKGIAISWNENGQEIQNIGFQGLHDIINEYSRGFIELGLKKGDRVALVSGNNPQWMSLSLGANNTGIIDVPINEQSTNASLEYILNHSQPKILIVEDEKTLNKINLTKHPEISYIYSIKNIDGIKNIADLQELGWKSKARIFEVFPDDTAGIIYTSGTTSEPKGVELSHYNLISNIETMQDMLQLNSADRGISNLPPWHVFERTHKNLLLYNGINAFYSTTKTLTNDLKIQKPTMLVVVPRILSLVYEKVMDSINKKGLSGIFNKLYTISLDYTKRDWDFKKVIEYVPHKIADALFFSKVRNIFGGEVRYLVSGSTGLPRHIEDFFTAAGFDILEGYGMTETSPTISARIPKKKMHYTVGPLLKGIEGKIIDSNTGQVLPQGKEGVLYVKGPNVMKGYYKNEKETKKVLSEDGWLNTGDIAYFNKDNNLVITGREKDIIVLSNGENISPTPLEDALLRSKYISNAIVIGEDSWKNLGVLILPNFEEIKEYYKTHNMTYNTEFPINNLVNPLTRKKIPEIEKLYSKEIKDLVNDSYKFKPQESIKDFEFIKELRVGEELTATLKIIRRKIMLEYEETVSYMRKKMTGK
jgi:long-chain acyl-CoA synthetase